MYLTSYNHSKGKPFNHDATLQGSFSKILSGTPFDICCDINTIEIPANAVTIILE